MWNEAEIIPPQKKVRPSLQSHHREHTWVQEKFHGWVRKFHINFYYLLIHGQGLNSFHSVLPESLNKNKQNFRKPQKTYIKALLKTQNIYIKALSKGKKNIYIKAQRDRAKTRFKLVWNQFFDKFSKVAKKSK